MQIRTIKEELWEIAKRFPTLDGLLRRKIKSDTSVGDVWAETIQARNLNREHFSNVCWEYATTERVMPTPNDQLLVEIIHETRDRMYRDQRKLEQYEKYHNRKKYKSRSGDPWYRWMHRLLETKLPDDQLDELVKWCVWNGPKPEWVDD